MQGALWLVLALALVLGCLGEDAAANFEGSDAKTFLQKVDLNKDGKVSLDELKQMADRDAAEDAAVEKDEAFKELQSSPDELKQELEETKSHLATFFAAADLDKNGAVDGKELPSLLQAMEKDEDGQEFWDEEGEAKSFMQKVDLNKDGKVSLEEWKQMVKNDAGEDGALEVGEEEDEEGKGEAKKVLAGDKIADAVELDFQLDETMSHLVGFFQKADLDKDGFINATELPWTLQAMEREALGDDDEEGQQSEEGDEEGDEEGGDQEENEQDGSEEDAAEKDGAEKDGGEDGGEEEGDEKEGDEKTTA